MSPPVVVLVSGQPASGKTTLARLLAGHLSLAIVFGKSRPRRSKAVVSPGPVGSQASNTNKTTTLTLWLRVENNSKFVRGKTKARENIETYHLRRHAMQKLRGWEYELTFAYEDDADLDRQVEELLSEISREADLRNCFIEADLCEKGTERSW